MDNFTTIYLGLLGLILLLMTLLWLVSVAQKNAGIVDIFWGTGFVIAAWGYYVLADGQEARQLIVVTLATLWGMRLSLHIAWRNWGQGEDFRYRQFRQQFGPERYWWFSLFQVFWLQGVLMWLVSAPLLGAQLGDRPLNVLDAIALFAWVVGMFFEVVGDLQLTRFKQDPRNRGKLLTTGLWRYTRHPNYFGDAAVWWAFGLFGMAAGVPLTVLGSLLMTVLLLRVSGVTLLERTLKSKPGYESYMRRTSAFIPWFPKQ